MGKIEVKDAKKVRKFSMPIYMNVVLLALGIALVIWADKVTSLISIIIGATFLVLAAYNLIAYLRVENRDMKEMPKLVSAIALGIAGGFLIIQNGLIKEVISIVVGIFLLIESIFRLMELRRIKILLSSLIMVSVCSKSSHAKNTRQEYSSCYCSNCLLHY